MSASSRGCFTDEQPFAIVDAMSTTDSPDPLINALEKPWATANLCGFARLLADQSEERRNAIQQAAAKVMEAHRTGQSQSTGLTIRWLARTLSENGCQISYRVTERHIRNECACES